MQINQYTLTLKQIGSLELDKKKDVWNELLKKINITSWIRNITWTLEWKRRKEKRE